MRYLWTLVLACLLAGCSVALPANSYTGYYETHDGRKGKLVFDHVATLAEVRAAAEKELGESPESFYILESTSVIYR